MSAQPKFTPGPWSAVADHPNDSCECVRPPGGSLGSEVAVLWDDDKARRHANARLMAAAPEMYQALMDMVDRFAPFHMDGMGEAEIACAARARAVLAKAEGREP